MATWAGMGLQQATLQKQMGVYYLTLGVGAVIIGNVIWRVLCELWIVLFNIHALLASMEVRMGGYRLKNEAAFDKPALEPKPEQIEKETPRESVTVGPPKREPYGVTRPASVLGLT